ncbi:ImmA/IrrE family metallo-endopeptidase [Lachnospiraceae bacterium 42-17]
MNYNYIRKISADVIIRCNIKSFPIDCLRLLEHYGYRIYTYSELYTKNKELYNMCMSYSEDAFRSGSMRLIAYNDRKPQKRIRFSLMHELGHHVLKHKNDTSENENEANFFANNTLAPRIAIYYAKIKTESQASRLFHISSPAAQYAAQDFSRWCKEVCETGMHDYDKELYSQFYNREYDGFVYSIKKCEFCGADIYNFDGRYCRKGCMVHKSAQRSYSYYSLLSDEEHKSLSRLENNWLYDF